MLNLDGATGWVLDAKKKNKPPRYSHVIYYAHASCVDGSVKADSSRSIISSHELFGRMHSARTAPGQERSFAVTRHYLSEFSGLTGARFLI